MCHFPGDVLEECGILLYAALYAGLSAHLGQLRTVTSGSRWQVDQRFSGATVVSGSYPAVRRDRAAVVFVHGLSDETARARHQYLSVAIRHFNWQLNHGILRCLISVKRPTIATHRCASPSVCSGCHSRASYQALSRSQTADSGPGRAQT